MFPAGLSSWPLSACWQKRRSQCHRFLRHPSTSSSSSYSWYWAASQQPGLSSTLNSTQPGCSWMLRYLSSASITTKTWYRSRSSSTLWANWSTLSTFVPVLVLTITLWAYSWILRADCWVRGLACCSKTGQSALSFSLVARYYLALWVSCSCSAAVSAHETSYASGTSRNCQFLWRLRFPGGPDWRAAASCCHSTLRWFLWASVADSCSVGPWRSTRSS